MRFIFFCLCLLVYSISVNAKMICFQFAMKDPQCIDVSSNDTLEVIPDLKNKHCGEVIHLSSTGASLFNGCLKSEEDFLKFFSEKAGTGTLHAETSSKSTNPKTTSPPGPGSLKPFPFMRPSFGTKLCDLP